MAKEDLKILVVDDERDICDVLYTFLREGGHDVTCAFGGREALECYHAEAFDLVFLDIKLPDLDGIHVLEAMRKHRPDGKVVMVSGVLDDEVCDLCLYGPHRADGFIPKPCHARQIQEAIEAVVRRDGRYVRSHRDEAAHLAEKAARALEGRGLDAALLEIGPRGSLGAHLAAAMPPNGPLKAGLHLRHPSGLDPSLGIRAERLDEEVDDDGAPLLDDLSKATMELFDCPLVMGLVVLPRRFVVFLSDDSCRRSHRFSLPPGDPPSSEEPELVALARFGQWLHAPKAQ